MLGPGHQAAVIEAMQQVIRLPARAHAEFLLQDAAHVLTAGRCRRHPRGWARPRRSGTAAHPPRPGGAGVRCGAAPGGPPGPPGWSGRPRPERRGESIPRPGRSRGQNGPAWPARRLDDSADPFLREGFGQSLKFFEAVMALDNIDPAPGVIPTPNLSCPIDTIRGTGAPANFPAWYKPIVLRVCSRSSAVPLGPGKRGSSGDASDMFDQPDLDC